MPRVIVRSKKEVDGLKMLPRSARFAQVGHNPEVTGNSEVSATRCVAGLLPGSNDVNANGDDKLLYLYILTWRPERSSKPLVLAILT